MEQDGGNKDDDKLLSSEYILKFFHLSNWKNSVTFNKKGERLHEEYVY